MTVDDEVTNAPPARLSRAALDAENQRLKAVGTSRHSLRAYRDDIRHFEHDFGGLLPTTPPIVEDYLTQYSATLSPSTLRRRLASLAKYHREAQLPDPTKSDGIKALMRGIRVEKNRPTQQARPLTIALLVQLVKHWEAAMRTACAADSEAPQARHARQITLQALRDRAFFLIGFWCGLRADELVRLDRAHCTFAPIGDRPGLTLFLPSSKGDRAAGGSTWELPALPLYCPVAAYRDWIEAAGIQGGPVFRSITRWGQLGQDRLHVNSVFRMIQAALRASGMDATEIEGFSSHSLRRGFATEFTRHGGGLKELMAWVKWKNTDNALRYIESSGDAPLSLMTQWLHSQGVELAAPMPLSAEPARAIAPGPMPAANLPTNVVPLFSAMSTGPTKRSEEHRFEAMDRHVDETFFDDHDQPVPHKSPETSPKRSRPQRTSGIEAGRDGTSAAAIVWRIKITLLDVRPSVWRRVDIDPAVTFHELHDIIQAAMGWENFHLWEFQPDHTGKLSDVFAIGDEFGYVYDMGDYWEHHVAIEKGVSARAGKTYPLCVAGANACPPEDCGGPSGYVHMLRVLRGPRTIEREEIIDANGGRYNPKHFAIDEVNRSLDDQKGE